MKKLLALLFVALSSVTLHAQGVWTEENVDPNTGLRTGVIEINGATYTIGPNAELDFADLSGADLSGANLIEAHLDRADLSFADLSRADLTDADVSGPAILIGANLSGANLKGRLFGADLGWLYSAFSRGNYEEIQGLKPVVEANTDDIAQLNILRPAVQENAADIAQLITMMEAMSVQMQQLNARLDDQQASIEEKDQQIAELSQRPTLAEVQDARAGSLVFRANEETNVVTLEFEIQSSENLQDWVAQPEKVTATVPLDAEKKFVRIALAQE